MKFKKIFIICVVLNILGIGFLYYVYNKRMNENIVKNNVENISKVDNKIKEKNTKVKLVEYIDPECPACAPFYISLRKGIKGYQNLDIEYKFIEIHKNSKLLVHMLEASKKQGKFNELLGYMYENQSLFTDYATKDNIKIWNFISKNNIDLDISKLKIDMEDIDINLILKKDFDDAVNLGVQGTPTIFVNGVIQNNKPISEIIDYIDLEMAKLVKE